MYVCMYVFMYIIWVNYSYPAVTSMKHGRWGIIQINDRDGGLDARFVPWKHRVQRSNFPIFVS